MMSVPVRSATELAAALDNEVIDVEDSRTYNALLAALVALAERAERWEKAHDMAADMYADRAARVAELEARWQEIEHPFDQSEYDAMFERMTAAEARVAELELDLAEAMEGWRNNAKACANGSVELALERERVAELETALRETLDALERGDIYGAEYVRRWNNARLALAAGSPTGQESQA